MSRNSRQSIDDYPPDNSRQATPQRRQQPHHTTPETDTDTDTTDTTTHTSTQVQVHNASTIIHQTTTDKQHTHHHNHNHNRHHKHTTSTSPSHAGTGLLLSSGTRSEQVHKYNFFTARSDQLAIQPMGQGPHTLAHRVSQGRAH